MTTDGAAPDIKDFTIVGAGPTGLFAAFYAGMRGERVDDAARRAAHAGCHTTTSDGSLSPTQLVERVPVAAA